MIAIDLGRIGYVDALALQHRLVAARTDDRVDDVLVVCEHDPVYTVGRHADHGNVLDAATIPVVRADRGGDVTYHGPGQVIVYPIIRLTGPRRVRAYVDALLAACIRVAADHGITAHAAASRPGVWVGNDKLVAVGVRVQRGGTSHGLAFNVDPDFSHYAGIVPCGITDGGVCSLASLGVDTTVTATAATLVDALADTLDRPVRWVSPEDLDGVELAA
ncbi:MAG: lipoyl(octanoyl) transferase LipB [Actinobacteria bacterium]|nr:lipoyl(octanoyl) transferase LipB [Actinomycetota bacterium]